MLYITCKYIPPSSANVYAIASTNGVAPLDTMSCTYTKTKSVSEPKGNCSNCGYCSFFQSGLKQKI